MTYVRPIVFTTTALVITIAVILGLKYFKDVQTDYNAKLVNLIDQVNTVQAYQFEHDRGSKALIDISHSNLSRIQGEYVTQPKLAQGVVTAQLQVGSNLVAGEGKLKGSDIIFTPEYTGYGGAEIANDAKQYKKLMLVGTKSGSERRVGISDRLDVHGNLGVDGTSMANIVEVTGQVSVGSNAAAYVRKDGYIFGGGWVDGQNVMGRESVRLANNSVYMRKDGYIYAQSNLMSKVSVDGNRVQGRDYVRAGLSQIKSDGSINAKQLCLDNVCINKADINKYRGAQTSSACQVSDWTSWSGCSKPCGGGVQYKRRYVISPAVSDGTKCPELVGQQPCNTQACPVAAAPTGVVQQQAAVAAAAVTQVAGQVQAIDCLVSDWGAWSPCSKTCGGGTQTRERTILRLPANGGTKCPSLIDTPRECNTAACPVAQPINCVVSSWSDWTACSKPCGGGTQTRTRTITQQPANGGTQCPSLTDTPRECNMIGCIDIPTPYLWLRLDEISGMADKSVVKTWTGAVNSRNALGYGTGGVAEPVIIKSMEKFPFVRLGSGNNSKTSGNFFNCGSQTFNMATNGGFTVICNIRMRGAISAWERIFDFGNGLAGSDNMLLARSGVSTQWAMDFWNGTTSSTLRNFAESGVTGQWQTVAVRFTANAITFFEGNSIKKSGPACVLKNKTFSATYIGKSHWTADEYANMDVRDFIVYDRSVSDADVVSIMNYLNTKYASNVFNYKLLGVGKDNKLYVKDKLSSNWVLAADNTCCVYAAIQLNDGRILGLGTDNKLYIKSTLSSPWVLNTGSSCSGTGLCQMKDGTIVISAQGQCATKASVTDTNYCYYQPNVCKNIISVSQLNDGRLLGVTNYFSLTTKPASPWWEPWVDVPGSCCVIAAVQAPDGIIYGIGKDNKIYYKRTLTEPWIFGGENTCCVQFLAILN